MKRLQERSWASASEVEQRAMLEIHLIPLMRASSSPRYQSTTSARTARRRVIPGGAVGICSQLSLVHQLWRFSLQQRRQVLVLSYFLLYDSYTVSYLISCLPLFCFVFLLLCFFSVMQKTHFLVSTFLLVPLCLWLSAHLHTQALFSFHGKHQEFLTLSLVPCTLCVTFFLFQVTACVTRISHITFSPEITHFLVQLTLISLCSSQPFPKSFYCLFFTGSRTQQ